MKIYALCSEYAFFYSHLNSSVDPNTMANSSFLLHVYRFDTFMNSAMD